MLNNLLGLVALACAVWVIYEVWMVQKNKNTVEKLIWTVAALVFSILTAIVYYFTVKKKSQIQSGQQFSPFFTLTLVLNPKLCILR